MKDFDWRLKYAPKGYAYMKRRLPFEQLERAYSVRDVVSYTLGAMWRQIVRDYPGMYNPSAAHTRISVYPKETGENLNHLDPLKPRLGIEIEIRQPARF